MARFVRVPEPPGYAFVARCLTCGDTIALGTKIADLDGPAFKAYYHAACLPAGTTVHDVQEAPLHDHDHNSNG